MSLCILQHENASVVMFDYLVTDNDLKPVMEQHGLVLPEDLDFIKEQIAGPLDTNAAQGQKVPASSNCVKSLTGDYFNSRNFPGCLQHFEELRN